MVTQRLIDDVLALPPEDRLELVKRVWDSLGQSDLFQLSAPQRQELERRYAEFLQNPEDGESWEDVKAFVQARLWA